VAEARPRQLVVETVDDAGARIDALCCGADPTGGDVRRATDDDDAAVRELVQREENARTVVEYQRIAFEVGVDPETGGRVGRGHVVIDRGLIEDFDRVECRESAPVGTPDEHDSECSGQFHGATPWPRIVVERSAPARAWIAAIASRPPSLSVRVDPPRSGRPAGSGPLAAAVLARAGVARWPVESGAETALVRARTREY